jgi:peptidoglycan/LPS O-acetylase OafA/YrhL
LRQQQRAMACMSDNSPRQVAWPSSPPAKTGSSHAARVGILDGWRALSIIAVLAGHLLPLGPGWMQLNAAVAASGMAIFFTLSGYLITTILLKDPRVEPFLIRRLFRILPLAWLAMIILAVANRPDPTTLVANLLFAANLPPARLMHGGEHLWSLCLEVQFYAAVALLVVVLGRRGLYLLPVIAMAVTLARVVAAQPISIVTWHRVDEILAGGCLALLLAAKASPRRLPPYLTLACVALLLASAHPALLPTLGYLRPYFAAAAVGTSILAAPAWMSRAFNSATARYVAKISFALYVVHGMLSVTWLGGEGQSTLGKYLLRVPLLTATFLLAHLSTIWFEARAIALGKELVRRSEARGPADRSKVSS